MSEGGPKINSGSEAEGKRISHDREGREYEGGEVIERVMPEDFDSNEPLTTDAERRTIRGAKLKNTEQGK